jgi:hypothetical protein
MQKTIPHCLLRYTVVVAAVLFAVSAAFGAGVTPPEGFTAVFDGQSMTGWHGMPHFSPYDLAKMPAAERAKQIEAWTADAKKHWKVEDGELVNDGNGVYLTTDKELGDFELRIDYKTVALADSGIYLRATPQVQIWDSTKEGGKWGIGADKGSGGLWNNSPGAPGKDPLVLADKPFGQWNSMRILMIGERVTVYLNDKLVVDNARLENFWDRKLPMLRKGPIQLQTHGGEIRWRNIFVREIGVREANRRLQTRGAEGFQSIFNGKDLSGWTGAVDQYEVKDGAIGCQPHKGGTLHTKAEYSDFVARIEYRLPPGGNNGLAIRYPGQGDSAYVGMCEIQILDDTADMYRGLDPRQFNGSAYGMAAVHCGYLRPTGQWNFMEATVRGPTIVVELNGTRVLDTDLSKITTYMANSPHPGKTRTSGSFGFCGHGDAVMFRHIQIKPLGGK